VKSERLHLNPHLPKRLDMNSISEHTSESIKKTGDVSGYRYIFSLSNQTLQAHATQPPKNDKIKEERWFHTANGGIFF
jgi:hypothetical protein